MRLPFLGFIFGFLCLIFQSTAVNANFEFNEFGPEKLDTRKKPYTFTVNRQGTSQDTYFLELIHGDGNPIVLKDCSGKRFLKRLLCIAKNKWTSIRVRRYRALFAEVHLNSQKIVSRSEFNWKVGTLTKRITLDEVNQLKATVRGRRTARIKIRIYRTTTQINEPPLADFQFSASPSNPGLVSFDGSLSSDDGDIVSYAWDFGDGTMGSGVTPSHEYTRSGVYTVTLQVTDDGGLTDATSKTFSITLNQAPTAAFQATLSPNDSSIFLFDAGASTDDGTITSYNWDFGDGATGTGVTTSHRYSVSGTYTVTLEVVDDGGLTNSVSQSVTVAINQPPVARFQFSSAPGDTSTVLFDGSTSTDDGSIVSYNWDFGDGNTGTGVTTSHQYTVSGVYTVTLQVVDNLGLSNSVSQSFTITINQPPVANFQFSISPSDPSVVFFDGNLSTDDGSIAAYNWDFGDGATGTGVTTSHQYTDSGTFIVTLQVTDDGGLTRSSSQSVTVSVNQNPIADFNFTPSTQDPSLFSFDGSNSTDDGTIVSYNWDFGDGNTGTGVSTSHQYESSGTFIVTLQVVDNGGLTDSISKTVSVTLNQPPIARLSSNVTSGEVPLMVMFDGSASEDPDGGALTYAWDFGDGGTDTGITTAHLFENVGNFTVSLTVTDEDGATAVATLIIEVNPLALPPNPEEIAPPLPVGGTNSLSQSIAFLYTSNPPVQRDVIQSLINPNLASWVRGKVVDTNNQPVSGVKVSVLDHPEFGFTLTRPDGFYDFVVNGGMSYVINFENMAYLPLQRQVQVNAASSVVLEEVVVTSLDPKILPYTNNAPTPQLLVGSAVTDGDGTRTGTLYFPPNTNAEIVLPDGSKQALPNLNMRITEYTVGDQGPRAMPGSLPSTTDYTYAMELSADQAISLGSDKIEFNQPVAYYIENFINVPTGALVPFGFYNTQAGQWEARNNGIVLRVVGLDNGAVVLDSDGTGNPNLDIENAFGITLEERQSLAARFQVGDSFWRVQVDHFSAYDLNYLKQLANNDQPSDDPPPPPNDQDRQTCQAGGSFFELEARNFGERLPVYGTPFALTYKSNRTPGYKDNSTLRINYSNRLVNSVVNAAVGVFTIAGRQESILVTEQSPQATEFNWDGLDAFGRPVNGLQKVEVEISSIQGDEAQYLWRNCSLFADKQRCVRDGLFARYYSGSLTDARALEERTNIRKRSFFIGVLDWRNQGFGGWSLDIHHSYDPGANRLYRGNGTFRSEQDAHVNPIVQNCFQKIGGCTVDTTTGGDGGSTLDAFVQTPSLLVARADGSLLIGDTFGFQRRIRVVRPDNTINSFIGGGANLDDDNIPPLDVRIGDLTALEVLPNSEVIFADGGRVRKLGLNGLVTTIAGQTGVNPNAGDGGQAVNATFSRISDLAVSSDGAIYVATADLVRRIGSDGIVNTVAGRSGGSQVQPEDGLFASEVDFENISAIDLNNDGHLFIADNSWRSLVEILPDGNIQVVMGVRDNGNNSGDGGEARNASFTKINDMYIDEESNIYITRDRSSSMAGTVRRITPDRFIDTVVGASVELTNVIVQNNPGTPILDYLSDGALGVTKDINGKLIFSEGFRITKVDNLFQVSKSDGHFEVPSQNAKEIFIFNQDGRHLRTLHAKTRATKYEFVYDGDFVSEIRDGDGRTTTIMRDGAGNLEKIVSHYGVETIFQTNSEGYISQISTPDSDVYSFQYTDDGLMTRMNKPDGAFTTVTYTDEGYLRTDSDALGGFFELFTPNDDPNQRVLTTGENRRVSVKSIYLSNNTFNSEYVAEDGQLTTTISEGANFGVVVENRSVYNERMEQNPFLPADLIIKDLIYNAGPQYFMERNRDVNFDDPTNPDSEFTITDQFNENNQFVTRRTYDSRLNRYTYLSPEGKITTVTQDEQERPVRVEVDGIAPIDYVYDGDGRISQVVQGDRTITYAYDSNGYLASITNPLGEQVRYENNNEGKVTKQILEDGREVEFAYDGRNNLIGMKPPGKPWHVMTYNEQDRLTSYQPPALSGRSTPITFDYNLDKELIGFNRADGRSLTFNRDNLKRLTSITSNLGTTTLSYDLATKQVSQIVSEDGIQLDFAYNEDKLIQYDLANIGVSGALNITYNNRHMISGNSVEGGYVYDGDRQLVQRNITFTPVTINRSDSNNLIESILYTGFGGTPDTFEYNAFGEKTKHAYSMAGGTFGFDYTRDRLGRMTAIRETLGSGVENKSYTYDATGRLISATDNNGTTTYSYDSNSNLIEVRSDDPRLPASVMSASYDEQDRLLTFGSLSFGYNDDGELNSKTNSATNETTAYEYDLFGNLKRVTLPSGKVITYQADGLNRRVLRSDDGGVTFTKFIFKDQLNPVRMFKPDPAGGSDIIYDFHYASNPNVPDIISINGQSYRIISDHLGSVREVRDSSGAVVQELKYDAFGRVLLDTNPGFQPFGFAGGLYDHETGLVRFGARDYDGAIGRWTSKDRALFDGGYNLYNYANHDPVNFTDRIGETPFKTPPSVRINPEFQPPVPTPRDDDSDFVPPPLPPNGDRSDQRRDFIPRCNFGGVYPNCQSPPTPSGGVRGALPDDFLDDEDNSSCIN